MFHNTERPNALLGLSWLCSLVVSPLFIQSPALVGRLRTLITQQPAQAEDVINFRRQPTILYSLDEYP